MRIQKIICIAIYRLAFASPVIQWRTLTDRLQTKVVSSFYGMLIDLKALRFSIFLHQG